MGACRCRVSYQDRSGIEHAAEVIAESLFLAVALAVRQFKSGLLAAESLPDALTKLKIETLAEATSSHVVELGEVFRYAKEKSAKAPSQIVKREQVRELLGL